MLDTPEFDTIGIIFDEKKIETANVGISIQTSFSVTCRIDISGGIGSGGKSYVVTSDTKLTGPLTVSI